MSLFCLIGYVVFLVLVYKALDWLIRLLYIGGYAERYIFITGCDTGFGHVIAKRLDKLGCHVFAGCLTEAGEAELKKTCSDKLHVILLNVTKPESVRAAFEAVRTALPPGKGLWGILNNAGTFSSLGPPEWLTIDDYKSELAVNLYGLIDVTVTFLPLVKMARGRVVNTASVYGRFTAGICPPYTISKYGVEAFTDGLRRTLYPFGVRALLIEPGFHRTPLIGLKVMANNAQRCWNQSSEDVRQEYGEDYLTYLSTTGMKKLYDIGLEDINDVAYAYEHALLGRFPRARYVVGWDAKYLWLPIQWMPEWLGDMVLRKMDADMPPPAAVAKKDK